MWCDGAWDLVWIRKEIKLGRGWEILQRRRQGELRGPRSLKESRAGIMSREITRWEKLAHWSWTFYRWSSYASMTRPQHVSQEPVAEIQKMHILETKEVKGLWSRDTEWYFLGSARSGLWTGTNILMIVRERLGHRSSESSKRAGITSLIFTTISQCLPQCLANYLHSLNYWLQTTINIYQLPVSVN